MTGVLPDARVGVHLCVSVCLIVCDTETSTMKLLRFHLAVATQKNRNLSYTNVCLLLEILYFIPCNLNACTK